MTFSIRAATSADVDSIREVHQRSIGEVCSSVYSADEVAAWLDALRPERYPEMLVERDVFVAVDGVTLVGFGMLDLGAAIVNAVYVVPSLLRRGIGSRLVGSLEEVARAAGLGSLDLHSTLNAVPFYESLGYVSRGPARNELPSGVLLPCVAMHKSLGGCA